MKTAAIAELKAHLSSYLQKVKVGQEVVITEPPKGEPIAAQVRAALRAERDEGR